MKFSDLKLIPEILRAADEAGYTEPSPIQEMAIGPVLDGRDLVGCAQTGTGKTAAFAMPVLQLLHGSAAEGEHVIRALVLTPTRELALQIFENFQQYGSHLPLRSVVVFGGVSQVPQVEALKKGADILIATPGRLNDLTGQGYINLSRVEIFVLDEADRMLDMGFIRDVRRIQQQLPKKRQNLLFSATMPQEIKKMIATELHQPIMVTVTPDAPTVEEIDQRLYTVDKANKRRLLAYLLKEPGVYSALVFTRTKHGADRVVRDLRREGIQAQSIHGDKSQNARQAALSQFKSGKIQVLVATDIAARGLDISGLSHVFNYDLPNEPETYVHRIGRTGRAGHSGIAISFCCYDELDDLRSIEKLIKKEIPEVGGHPWPMEVFEESKPAPRPPRPPRGERDGRGGRRKPEKEAPVQAKKEAAPAARPDETQPVEGAALSRSAKRRRRRKAKKSAEAAVQEPPRQPQAPAKPKKREKESRKDVKPREEQKSAPEKAKAAPVKKPVRDVPVQPVSRPAKPLPMDQPLRRGGYSSCWKI